MAKNNETTTKFKVDISDLKKAMTEAKKQVALANSEFKAASSSMDDWSKSSDGISQKLKQLNSNLKAQESVLDEYEKTLEEVKKQYGENSKEAMEYQTSLNNQKAVVNKTKKEIANYEDALDKVSAAEAEAAKTGKSVSDILEDTGKNAEDAGDGFTTLKGAVATFAGNVLTSLVSGLKDAASNLLSLADSTREYRDQMGKLESASADAGYGVDYAKDKYMDLYGVLADETATTTAINNLMAIGAEEDTLNSLLNSSIGIWSKYGDSISLDGLAEAINHTSKLGEVQGNLADALEWSGITVDDFNAQLADCATEQERQELIAQTLDGLYGDLSKSYQENNASIIEANKANAEYNDTVADIGEKIEPVTTKIKEGFNAVLEKILELIGDGDLSSWTDKIEKGFSVVTEDILPAIKKGLKWIIDNKDILLAGIAAIAAGMLAWNVTAIITSVVTAIKGWIVATEGMTVAQRLLNLAMKANPIGIVITLITALVAAFVVLWNKSESFRQFWINLWDNIKKTADTAVKAIVKFFTDCWTTIKNAWSGVTKFFSNIWTNIKSTFSVVADTIGGFFSSAWNKVKNTWSGVTGFFSGVWSGIKNAFSNVSDWFKNTFTTAWTNVKNVFSTGGKIFSGIKEGIENTFKTVVNGIISGINTIIATPFNAINGMLNKIRNASFLGVSPFKNMWSQDPLYVPQIPQLAKGGITTGATLAEIGEAGREAVLPLERNTGWMRLLAKELVNEMRMSNNSITGVATGGTGVVNNFYQTNNSPKALSRLEIYRQSRNLLNYAGGGV